MAETLIEVENLRKHFPIETGLLARLRGNQQFVHAVDGIDFKINRGEIFGLAGESGCGKTTTGECLTRITDPTGGTIRFGESREDIAEYGTSELKAFRREAQIIFQDPYESINDRFTVERWVKEPLIIHDIGSPDERVEQVERSLERAGLTPPAQFLDQYPHELSGGQRQRIAIARALVVNPSFIVADEPTSMLDVSVRAGILRLFTRLVEEADLTILYISHDLSLLRYICDRIGIMYQGELVEVGDANTVLRSPKHPYTQALVSAVPRADPRKGRERVQIKGEVEERIGGITGCPFKFRCPHRFDLCDEDPPFYNTTGGDQKTACHLYDDDVDEPLPDQQGTHAGSDSL